MQASDASTSRAAMNISAAFSPYAQLPVVPDGRNFHSLAPIDATSMLSKDTPMTQARTLLETLRRTSSSLDTAMNYPILDQRAVTLYKESSQHEHAIHKATFTAQLTLQALRVAHEKAASTNHFQPSSFGLSVPLLRSNLATFIISRIEEWATAAGLEYFLDDPHSTSLDASVVAFPTLAGIQAQKIQGDGKSGKKITISLTKEELLVDLEFEKNLYADDKRIDLPLNHHIVPLSLQHIKIHNGEHDDTSAGADGLLGGTLHQLLEEKMRGLLKLLGCEDGRTWSQLDVRSAERAAEELKMVLAQLKWIAESVKQEEEHTAGNGLKWWRCIPDITEKMMEKLRSEQTLLNLGANPGSVPLDTLLLRSTALPFPYLDSFSITSILYLPPLAYLTILRSIKDKEVISDPLAITDIPILDVRRLLSDVTARQRLHIPLCTLAFEPSSPSPNTSVNPTEDTTMDHSSSSDQDAAKSSTFLTPSSESIKGRWILSFSTDSSGTPLILSQSRMKRLATAINVRPEADSHGFALLTLGVTPAAVGPSWLDLTIDPHSTQPSRIYTSRYSPKSSASAREDPELLNSLLPVVEPGLALGKIPAKNLEEAMEVMKVVKEQLWINGLLRDAMFQPGYIAMDVGLQSTSNGVGSNNVDGMGTDEAKAMYDALMGGSYVSQRLRVNYEVLNDGRTGLKASFPLSGKVVVVQVALDGSTEKGMRVTVDDERVEMLEEVLRRGGLLALIIAARNLHLKSI